MPYIEDDNKTTYDRLYRAARSSQKRLDIMVADKYDPSWIKDAEQQRDDAVKALGDFVRISGMTDYMTPADDQPDIESIYEALQ